VPTHWTYKEFKASDDLFQGDVIAREPLVNVIKRVHENFLDPQYLAFIIITQTCDMVLRKGRCKTRHIGLAGVRSIASLLPDLLTEMCESPYPGVFTAESKFEAEQFLHRVMNQNEQAHGMVYLHSDGDVGIGEPAVALLRVSISLEAKEHYELLRSARCGRLDTEYRNKLGWLAGNLYSRVDTMDWAEHIDGEAEEKRIIADLLSGSPGEAKNAWVPAAWLATVRRKKIDLKNIPPSEIEAVLREHAPPPPLEVAVAEIKKITQQLSGDFGEKPISAFRQKLTDDPCLLPLIRPSLAAVVTATLVDHSAGQLAAFLDAAMADHDLHAQVVVLLQEVAAAFLAARAPKPLTAFIASVQQTPIFSEAAIGRFGDLAKNAFDSAFISRKEAIEGRLREAKPNNGLVGHLRSLALESIQETFSERLVARLENDPAFRNAVKSK
jgi:hypothetical protein